eukprot:CAMPEP_0177669988 /NCGR_PEP_ID=MMETSP0447-20121125/23817_1 /TAXON_ID=0 /ORGANISM="Stygamoeba regulata, Strain BSH-02190019" /LENGTH=560 /DNA_ID=CAMNT_0019177057 /DNA_START=237 /DNA_END=1916 /DNA_ORIENTATION=+
MCFFSLPAGEVTEVVKFEDITLISRKNTALVVPNAIEIVTSRKHFFSHFPNRDEALHLLKFLWEVRHVVGPILVGGRLFTEALGSIKFPGESRVFQQRFKSMLPEGELLCSLYACTLHECRPGTKDPPRGTLYITQRYLCFDSATSAKVIPLRKITAIRMGRCSCDGPPNVCSACSGPVPCECCAATGETSKSAESPAERSSERGSERERGVEVVELIKTSGKMVAVADTDCDRMLAVLLHFWRVETPLAPLPPVLVFGATSLCGAMALKQMVQDQKVYVKAAVSESDGPGRAYLQALGVATVAVNFSHPPSIIACLRGVRRVVFHSSLDSAELAQLSAVAAVLKSLQTSAGVDYVVLLSYTAALCGEAFKPTASRTASSASSASNLVQALTDLEEAVRQCGTPFTTLHVNFPMQLLFSLPELLTRCVLALPLDDVCLPWVDLRDVGKVVAMLVASPLPNVCGKAFHLTGQEALSCRSMAAILMGAMQKRVDFRPLTLNQYRHALTGRGVPETCIRNTLALYELARTPPFQAVSTDVCHLLSQPATLFRQFVADNVVMFK